MSTVVVFSTMGYSNNKRWYPHGTEHPHGTQDNPHGTHDIPHGTEHPSRYCTHIIQGDVLGKISKCR